MALTLKDLAKKLKEMYLSYPSQVSANKQNLPSPFFNNTGNNPIQWLGKVSQDVKTRGPFEGLQDLTNPVIQNRFVYPYAEPIISDVRTLNYQAGRPNNLINALLGQTNAQYGIRSPKSIFNWQGY